MNLTTRLCTGAPARRATKPAARGGRTTTVATECRGYFPLPVPQYFTLIPATAECALR